MLNCSFYLFVSMERVCISIVLCCCLFLLVHPTLSLPLCSDSTAPFTLNTTLKFCQYNGSSCCDSMDDLQIQKQFEAMNISDSGCASLIKPILCARCDPFSADLYSIFSTPQPVPVLCNSTNSASSPQSKEEEKDFCSEVWDTCQNISISNSPFAPSLQGSAGVGPLNSSASKLTELWQSKTDFCYAFGGSSSDNSVCFDGEPVLLNNTEISTPPHGLCLEKIGNGSFINMVAHPDGSNRAFFSNQPGKIWLATIPEMGSGGLLGINESDPFVDLTDDVHFDIAFGMMGMAFHPNFQQNGRFFASINCDKVQWPGCSGRCTCNSDVNCDPSQLPYENKNDQPCRYHSVVAEYTVNGSASEPFLATSATPAEVRRIISMGLPTSSAHAGQILFGPDGYLYFMMGDGGLSDRYDLAQNTKSLLGKIMRLDVDNIPSAEEIESLGLWGNYSIPKSNPFAGDKTKAPEIWALGFMNPWRCSFDSERPAYFLCGDVGEDRYEEVNIITKGGNYGWRFYEGPYIYNTSEAPDGSPSANSTNPIFPVMGYTHSEVKNNLGSASITGGYFYRSTTDPCMSGRYLFADLYGSAVWVGTENPENSGNFTATNINFTCAHDSPMACSFVSNDSLPSLGYIFSFGEDNRKDIYFLTSNGVYRVVPPSRCNYTCSKEDVTTVGSPSPSSLPGSYTSQLQGQGNSILFLLSLLLFFHLF